MAGWTKLDSAIVHSSIWAEGHTTRLLWITMLAMVDKDGIVACSVGGLAHAARISRDECEAGLAVLRSPDPDSRDGTTGERIEPVSGGWLLLNHANYRDTQTRQQKQNADRVRRYRERSVTDHYTPLQTITETDVTGGNARSRAPVSVSESESKKKKEVLAPLEDAECEALRQEWVAIRRERHRIKTLTARAWTQCLNRAKRAGVSMRDMLTQLCDHGWQTWKEDYTKSPYRKEEGQSHHVNQVQHQSDLDIGDPACECWSCIAFRRDAS